MQVILIRHGMTHGNSKGQYIGRTDEPLAPMGTEGIRALGVDPGLNRVYVTPLIRTQQTAAILFPNAEQIVAEDLREMDFGDFEGRSADDMIDDGTYTAWVEANCEPPCPNGESMLSFALRVRREFSRILTEEEQRGSDSVTFVVHGGTIMAILEHFALPHREYYSYGVGNGGGYRCQVVPGTPFVLTDLSSWTEKR